MSTLKLSNLNSDFDSIVEQLQTYLASKDSWKGLLPTQTGQTILEMIAAVGAYDSLKLTRSYEDAFPFTAVSDQAIYAGASAQGVRILRKSPASLSAEVVAPVDTNVPAYSQFQGGGNYFFNRDAFVASSSPTTVTLYQGRVVQVLINGLGTDYQMFISQEQGFQVSDSDVKVYLNSTPLQRTEDGLWKLKGIAGFRDRTLPDGSLAIEFGNAIYGSRPSQTDQVVIIYCLTSGSSGNNLNVSGKKHALATDSTVVATPSGNPTGGADEQSPLVYKNISAATFGNFGSAVTRDEYSATARSYPGIVDAVVQAQRDVNPTALAWMNVMRVTALTSVPWNGTQNTNYLNWLQSKTMYAPRFIMEAPVPVAVAVSATIFCSNWTNTAQARQDAIAAVEALFQPTSGYLGKDIALSDLYAAILNSNKGIEYVDLDSPTTDMWVSNTPAAAPGYTVINSGGSLAIDTYHYAISVVTSYGEIAPKNWSTVAVSSGSSKVQLNWAPRSDALHYKVYGRGSAGVYGVIYTGTSNAFLDTGVVTPTGTVPTSNSTPIRYNSLNSVAVQAKFSTRSRT